jgi:excisionase family DNA binding protein
MAPDTPREWRSVRDIPAERPWVTERWLRRLLHEKRIPYAKVGNKVLIDLHELDAYIERSIVDPK